LALGSQCGSCQTCAKECLSRIHQQHSASQAVTPCFI
jgi:bacterioferritin-associated ferredoxin